MLKLQIVIDVAQFKLYRIEIALKASKTKQEQRNTIGYWLKTTVVYGGQIVISGGNVGLWWDEIHSGIRDEVQRMLLNGKPRLPPL